MESLADYFDRTKYEIQRSLERLGHRSKSRASSSSSSSAEGVTEKREIELASLSSNERHSSAS